MRRRSPILAAAVVLLANGAALLGVARNRAGEPESEAWLTERELPFAADTGETTGVFLRLDWQRCSAPCPKAEWPWLDRAKLEAIGFDCRLAPDAEGAREHYERMLPKPAYVVLELDGPVFREWQEAALTQPAKEEGRGSASRLVPIDAGRDPAELRRRHPDRARCLIVPAVVGVRVELVGEGKEARLAVRGGIHHLATGPVHVPKHLAGPLAGLARARAGPAAAPRYAVRLRFGRRFEPWVVEVASPPPAP